MRSSIGRCNVSNEDCDLFQYPYFTATTNLESNLEGILGPYHFQAILSAVSATEANSPSGIKPTYLFRLWIISETLAEGAVESNTQWTRNKYGNVFYRHFTTNKLVL